MNSLFRMSWTGRILDHNNFQGFLPGVFLPLTSLTRLYVELFTTRKKKKLALERERERDHFFFPGICVDARAGTSGQLS